MGNFARRTARSAAVAVMACAAALGASATAGAADDPSAKTPVKPFVVGGEEANIEDYPYTVRLITPDGFGFCGGSLVAPDKVVTAAHCVEGAELEDFKVVSGRTVMSSDEGTVSDVSEKGKPTARWGRKATGPTRSAGRTERRRSADVAADPSQGEPDGRAWGAAHPLRGGEHVPG